MFTFEVSIFSTFCVISLSYLQASQLALTDRTHALFNNKTPAKNKGFKGLSVTPEGLPTLHPFTSLYPLLPLFQSFA